MSNPKFVTEHLFRTKYGEILAALLRYAGYENFAAAEEAVQTAFQRALEKWLYTGVPQNPAGWLYAVARNAYLESIRRKKTEQLKYEHLQPESDLVSEEDLQDGFAETSNPPDDLATMILLCCNPELSPKAQVCLTLKSACGFSVREIARALDMQEEAVKKTITRAKEKVAEERGGLQSLNASRITERFALVMETIYAMFTEGYAASSGEAQLRRDIAEEAIRLADIFLRTMFTPESRRGELQALIALMLFQFARFDARADESGMPLRLQEQDRAKWNADMIQAALRALEASQTSPAPTVYHLEARIAAEHTTSASFASINWTSILSLYDQLLLQKDKPAVRLSRIVALRYVRGWETAWDELNRLESIGTHEVTRSFIFHAVRADLLESAGRHAEAAADWEKARDSAPTTADRVFAENKRQQLS